MHRLNGFGFQVQSSTTDIQETTAELLHSLTWRSRLDLCLGRWQGLRCMRHSCSTTTVEDFIRLAWAMPPSMPPAPPMAIISGQSRTGNWFRFASYYAGRGLRDTRLLRLASTQRYSQMLLVVGGVTLAFAPMMLCVGKWDHKLGEEGISVQSRSQRLKFYTDLGALHFLPRTVKLTRVGSGESFCLRRTVAC